MIVAKQVQDTVNQQSRHFALEGFAALFGLAPRLLDGETEKVSLGDYLWGAGYSAEFTDHYVVPMGAAIWSAEPGRFLEMPAVTFIRFFQNHGMLETNPSLPWRVIRGGSARYVERLCAAFRTRIHLRESVRAVRRHAEFVEVAVSSGATARVTPPAVAT